MKFPSKPSQLFVTIFLVACACVAMAGNLGPDDQQISFTGVPGTNETDAVTPDICYSPDSERYLVVWSADETDGDFHIYGQLLTSASGAKVGPVFPISSAGVAGSDHRQPAVAYSPLTEEYFVIWSSDALNQGAYEIMGQRVNENGDLIGGNMRLSDMGTNDVDGLYDAVTPALAWQPFANTYIVIWAGDDDAVLVGDGKFELYGQFVDSNAAEIGTDFRITNAGSSDSHDVLRPVIVAHPNLDRWYIGLEVDLSDNGFHDSEVWLLGGTSTTADGSAVRVSDMGGAQEDGFGARNVDIALSADNSELMFVWDGTDGAGQTRQVFGQKMGIDGSYIGGMLSLSNSVDPAIPPLREAAWPTVAVDPTTSEWFVAWRGARDVGVPHFVHEVLGGRFDNTGAPAELFYFALSSMNPTLWAPAGAGRPALAINTNFGSKMVAWSGDLDITADGEHEIFTQGWVDDATTNVGETPGAGDFALYGAAPNPFNPMTTIAFNLPRSETVNLRVYDISGRVVRNLLVGSTADAGRNEVIWNGRDDNERTVASGVYFYRLETPSDQAHGRMTLVK